MNLIPCEDWDFIVAESPQVLAERLGAHVQASALELRWPWSRMPFSGVVTLRGFNLVVSVRPFVSPMVSGRFEPFVGGTHVSARLSMRPKLFGMVSALSLLIGGALLLSPYLESWWPTAALAVPLVMLASAWLDFHLGVPYLKTALAECFGASPNVAEDEYRPCVTIAELRTRFEVSKHVCGKCGHHAAAFTCEASGLPLCIACGLSTRDGDPKRADIAQILKTICPYCNATLVPVKEHQVEARL